MKILRGPDAARPDALRGRTVAVLGYGNQGHAHALNLRDSGLLVLIGARPGSSRAARAMQAGFDVMAIDQAVARADLVIMAVADQAQPEVYREYAADQLRPGAVLGFLHGLSIRYNLIEPRRDIGVVMVAPKGPGVLLRQRFEQGRGLPCLLAVHQSPPGTNAEAVALAWAAGIGCGRAAILFTTFADEAETDLFGEQAVLCGGMSELIVAAFETLVNAGYPPELAYLECCQEVKQIADLVFERGLAGMRQAISATAEFGAYRAGPRVIDEQVRARLRELLGEIRGGAFIEALRADAAQAFLQRDADRRRAAEHPIERAGEVVRGLTPWIDPSPGRHE